MRIRGCSCWAIVLKVAPHAWFHLQWRCSTYLVR
jgi:hypothetical protein